MWGRVTAGRRGDRSQLARERKVRTLPIMATTSLGGEPKSALPLGVRASLPSLGLGGAETCKCRVAFGLRRFMAPANSLLPRCHSFRPRQAEPQTHNLSVSWDRRHAADRLPAKVAAQCKDRKSLPPSCNVSLCSAGALATARAPCANWRIIQTPPQLVDCVIARELTHLIHANHLADF